MTTPNATPPDPDDACEAAYAAACAATQSVRTRRGLARVKRALDHLVAVGATDYGIANVARAVESLTPGEGPREQSIRNSEGLHYRKVIDAYRLTHGRAAARVAQDSESDDLLAAIRDPAVAARVRDLQLRLEELTRRNEWLKRQYGELRAIDPRALLGTPAAASAAGSAVPSPQARRAARHFLDRATELLECEWEADSGALLTVSGHTVAGRGFREALERLASDDGEETARGSVSSRTPRLPAG